MESISHKDIESLGFKYLINMFLFPTYQLDNYYLYDCSLEMPNKFRIMRGAWKNKDIIFEGTIKNKSELKRILKQINKNNMKPHQLRVVEEAKELKDKTVKLNDFIGGSEFFESLDVEEKRRLMKQLRVMSAYLEILEERINNF